MKKYLLFVMSVVSPFCYGAKEGRLSRSSSVSALTPPKFNKSLRSEARLSESAGLRLDASDDSLQIQAKPMQDHRFEKLKTFLSANQFINIFDPDQVNSRQAKLFLGYIGFMYLNGYSDVVFKMLYDEMKSLVNSQISFELKTEKNNLNAISWLKYSKEFIEKVYDLDLCTEVVFENFLKEINATQVKVAISHSDDLKELYFYQGLHDRWPLISYSPPKKR